MAGTFTRIMLIYMVINVGLIAMGTTAVAVDNVIALIPLKEYVDYKDIDQYQATNTSSWNIPQVSASNDTSKYMLQKNETGIVFGITAFFNSVILVIRWIGIISIYLFAPLGITLAVGAPFPIVLLFGVIPSILLIFAIIAFVRGYEL